MERVLGMRRALSVFWRELRWGDWVILVALLGVVALTAMPRPAGRTGGSLAIVHLPDGSERPLTLAKDGDYTFEGLRGSSVLRVEDGTIRFVESACPNQLCVQWGRIHREGEIRVCLPNQVWVTIQGAGEKPSIDALSH